MSDELHLDEDHFTNFTDSKKTDTDTIFPNYPGYTDNGYTDIY